MPLLLFACVVITACSSYQRVQSNYDDGKNFDGYQSFGLADSTKIEDPDLRETLELYFTAAVAQQLLKRDLHNANPPELLINVSATLEDVSRAPVNGRNCPSYEDYNSRRVTRTGGSRRPMCLYKEGAVEISIVDLKDGHEVFTGSSRVRLDEDDRGAALLQSVAYDVDVMFGENPARQGEPVSY